MAVTARFGTPLKLAMSCRCVGAGCTTPPAPPTPVSARFSPSIMLMVGSLSAGRLLFAGPVMGHDLIGERPIVGDDELSGHGVWGQALETSAVIRRRLCLASRRRQAHGK